MHSGCDIVKLEEQRTDSKGKFSKLEKSNLLVNGDKMGPGGVDCEALGNIGDFVGGVGVVGTLACFASRPVRTPANLPKA
jgi:hypothetical protein